MRWLVAFEPFQTGERLGVARVDVQRLAVAAARGDPIAGVFVAAPEQRLTLILTGVVGLAMCRRIVEQHGGTIRVESNAGEGSRFIFTLSRNRG